MTTPAPPSLKREITQSASSPAWWQSTHDKAIDYWENARNQFPEEFHGTVFIGALHSNFPKRTTNGIEGNIGYYGVAYTHRPSEFDHLSALDCRMRGDLETDYEHLFPTLGHAIYEISLMVMDAVKSYLRHILYSSPEFIETNFRHLPLVVDCIAETGLMLYPPPDQPNCENAHADGC